VATRAAFTFVFVTVALDMIALGIMIPVLPKLVVQMEGGDIAAAAGVTGVFGVVWAAMQFVFGPVMGALSDRHGRRPVILLSNVGVGVDYLFMALAPNLAWLFLGRVINGVTSASLPAATAYITDVTPPEERAGKFGMLGAAFGLGFVVGPAIGGLLGQIDLRLPFWVAAGFSLANAAYGFFVLPESLPRAKRTRVAWHLANPFGSLRLLRSHPELITLSIASFLYFLAHESLPNCFVLYTDYRYGWNERDVGVALAIVGVCGAIVQAALVGPAVARLGERRALLLGLAFGVVAFVVFGAAPTGALYLVGIPFSALWGLAGPPIQALMTKRVGPEEQGRLQGAITSLQGVAGMVAPIAFTQVLATAIRAPGGMHVPGAPWFLSGLLLVASVGVSLRAAR
jgi:MFS transporter, DHA1 family, tetracycline resistance protein